MKTKSFSKQSSAFMSSHTTCAPAHSHTRRFSSTFDKTAPSLPTHNRRIKKIHWNVLTACNMSCSFCYLWRYPKQFALSTNHGRQLIKEISRQADWITFGGGDPLMRPDLPELVALAKNLGLKVDLQTNGLLLKGHLFETIAPNLDRIGLSLDGDEATCHDMVRSYPGNFDQVQAALHLCDQAKIPIVVRTMVCKLNLSRLSGISTILARYKSVLKWSLRQFVPLGRGADHASEYSISKSVFVKESTRLQNECSSNFFTFNVSIVSKDEMQQCYCLITPDGRIYAHPSQGDYQCTGKFPEMSLSDLLVKLPYDRKKRDLRDSFTSLSKTSRANYARTASE